MLTESILTDALSRLTSLTRLHTWNSDLSNLSHLYNLQHLVLESYIADINVLPHLQQLTQLRMQVSRPTYFVSPVHHAPALALPIARLTSLVVLELRDEHINTETIVEMMTHCTRLRELELDTPPLNCPKMVAGLEASPSLNLFCTNQPALMEELRKNKALRKRIKVRYICHHFHRSHIPYTGRVRQYHRGALNSDSD